jgi:hypothetical protein
MMQQLNSLTLRTFSIICIKIQHITFWGHSWSLSSGFVLQNKMLLLVTGEGPGGSEDTIPCQCSKVYVGQSGHTVEKRVEHQRHIRLAHPEKSAVAIGSDFRRQKSLPASLDTWTDSSGKQ